MYYYRNETDLLVNSCQADCSLSTIMMLYLRISRDSAMNNEA